MFKWFAFQFGRENVAYRCRGRSIMTGNLMIRNGAKYSRKKVTIYCARAFLDLAPGHKNSVILLAVIPCPARPTHLHIF